MIYMLSVWFTHIIFLTFIRDFNLATLMFFVIVWLQWLLILGIVNKGIHSDPLW